MWKDFSLFSRDSSLLEYYFCQTDSRMEVRMFKQRLAFCNDSDDRELFTFLLLHSFDVAHKAWAWRNIYGTWRKGLGKIWKNNFGNCSRFILVWIFNCISCIHFSEFDWYYKQRVSPWPKLESKHMVVRSWLFCHFCSFYTCSKNRDFC